MKESLGRIKEWVKKHPYLAGAILLGVVFLAYLAIKRGGGGGGGSGGYDLGEPGEGPDEDTGMPLGLGGGGDTGLSAGGFQPVSEPSPEPAESSGSFGGNGYTKPVPSVVGPSYTIPETYPLAGGAGLSSPAMSYMVSDQTGQPVTSPVGPARVMPSKSNVSQVTRAKKAVQARVTQTYKGPTAPPAGATENARKLSALNAPSEQQRERKGSPPASLTPAQKVGKSRYFTGYWQGIWYVLGYPRTMSSAGTIGTNTGAAKPTQAGSKKRAR